MFTGLVADLGSVAAIAGGDDGVRLSVETALAGEISLGDSISVNGVCLTATTLLEGGFTTDVMNETLARSSLGAVAEGSPVNLELALRAADRLGGHVVQGHVDDVGRIATITPDGFSRRVEIEAPEAVLRYLVHKGSVTVDGISLTVASLQERSFTVALIPETLERTNLGGAEIGQPVNLEVDVLAKYVERLMTPR